MDEGLWLKLMYKKKTEWYMQFQDKQGFHTINANLKLSATCSCESKTDTSL